MKHPMLETVVALAERTGKVFVVTASAAGLPHLAGARRFALLPDGLVRVADWFCPTTASNLGENLHVALVVWDGATGEGYQVLGVVQAERTAAMLDGYEPSAERGGVQAERELTVRVDKILAFSEVPHEDEAVLI